MKEEDVRRNYFSILAKYQNCLKPMVKGTDTCPHLPPWGILIENVIPRGEVWESMWCKTSPSDSYV